MVLASERPTAAARLGVFGWPVSHSRSPAMQNAALAAVGLGEWRYQLLPVPPELFDETARSLPAVGFRGANVTIPHKPAALAVADEASDAAREIGAANTLLYESDGTIIAENTDAPALIKALPFPVAGRTALVLGAGGTARAAVWALRDAGAAEVRVWNRTHSRAVELCGDLGGIPVSRIDSADVIVHCTSAGMDPKVDPLQELPLTRDAVADFACVVDFVYRAGADTPLIAAAHERGVATVDGLELLVGQGALAFERFTGIEAPYGIMRTAVRVPRASASRPDSRPTWASPQEPEL